MNIISRKHTAFADSAVYFHRKKENYKRVEWEVVYRIFCNRRSGVNRRCLGWINLKYNRGKYIQYISWKGSCYQRNIFAQSKTSDAEYTTLVLIPLWKGLKQPIKSWLWKKIWRWYWEIVLLLCHYKIFISNSSHFNFKWQVCWNHSWK